eukprot:TRINITY_DN417_c0_g3_i1.p1 TRINITY_DN417_c0_g3~~TRINITY_DN417_c0_g3_i1.p1  ORF type:complete len:173 (-),score=6.48 TRINITY_DN417_c0_g3_i1:115-633(-)
MAVRLTTTLGDIEITLHPRDTPRTCRNFLELCKHGYYDGVLFHQVVKDTLIKTGDPYGNGTGGESIYGPTFDDEITKKLSHDRMGVVSMANDGHNTNGSMFIITLDAVCTIIAVVMSSVTTVSIASHAVYGVLIPLPPPHPRDADGTLGWASHHIWFRTRDVMGHAKGVQYG